MPYSNKVTITVESTNYIVKKVDLYVSTDGQNWSDTAAGNPIYFKAEVYDSNGNLVDDTIFGMTNLIYNNDLPYTFTVIRGTGDESGITTDGGIAIWKVQVPTKVCCQFPNEYGQGYVFTNAYPTPNRNNYTVGSNTVKINYGAGVEICQAARIDLLFDPSPNLITVYCPTPTSFYQLIPNQTYTWEIHVTDSNGNDCPYCTLMGAYVNYLFNKNTVTTDQYGRISVKWTAPSVSSGEVKYLPGYLPMFSQACNWASLPVFFLGTNVSNDLQNFIITEGFPSSASFSGITAEMTDNGIEVILNAPSNENLQLLAYDPSTGYVSPTVTYTAYVYNNQTQSFNLQQVTQELPTIVNGMGTFTLKGYLNSTIYLVLASTCVPHKYKSTPIIMIYGPSEPDPYGGMEFLGGVTVCYGTIVNGVCQQ